MDILERTGRFSFTRKDLTRLPSRPDRSNKKTFGRVLVAAGSAGMAGAAYFAAKAAYRSGAGLVELLTSPENIPVLQVLIPEAIVTSAYVAGESAIDRDRIAAALERADSMVIGCGLGVSPASRELLSFCLRHKSCPAVIDADGLNLLSANPSLLRYAEGAVITPHPGEMSRLTGMSAEDILADTVGVAKSFAKRHGLVCLLKDHNTVVSRGEGDVYINKSGNNGMATGGSGDVLAGIIGALLAGVNSSLSAFDAACLGAYIHGLAGDAAARRLSKHSLMASDIIDSLPEIFAFENNK